MTEEIKKKKRMKKWVKIILIILGIFLLITLFSPNKNLDNQNTIKKVEEVKKSYEDGNYSFINETTKNTDLKNYPKDTDNSKVIYIDMLQKSFWSDNTAVKEISDNAIKVFKEKFKDKNVSNIYVYYNGTTTDKYGNESLSKIMMFYMNKRLFDKINWDNYSPNNKEFCDLLRSEFAGGEGDGSCIIYLSQLQY